MKKYFVLLASLMVFLIPLNSFGVPYYNWDFNLSGYSSHTYDYADVVNLNNTSIGFLQTHSWSHALPGGFSSSTNSVTDAQMWISASGVMSDNSTVADIQGLGQWEYLEGQDWHLTWSWRVVFDDPTSETVIDLPSSMNNFAFWEQDPINVTVGTGQFFTSVNLQQSVLMMDYNDRPSSNTPGEVPEPTTMALFGLGLFGMGIIRKLKR